jgi:phage repressor protein C with HTH and peptisase S24 domain
MAINNRIKKIRELFFNDKNILFAKELGISRQYANNIVSDGVSVGDSILELIMEKIPSINPVWLKMGEGEMLKTATNREINSSEGIPLYTVEMATGFGTDNFSVDEKNIESRYKIRELETASFMIYVRGNSMEPAYCNGDIIAVKKIIDRRTIQWGKPHLISSSTQGLLFKRIYEDEGNIVCVSDNSTYKPINIKKENVTGVASVVGVIRFESY